MVISMDRWKGKVAIVTGASSGIGAAIAEQLVNHGLLVVALARRNEKLEELSRKLRGKQGKLYPFRADVSKEEDILAAFKWTKDNLGPVHVLVNNAGVSRKTTLMEGPTNSWREVLDTNVLGLCIATREAVQDMRANNVDGHIFHMNSILGHYIAGHENINVYPASKYALTALTETLRQELNSIGSKIKITSVSPGVVLTEIRDAGGYMDSKEAQEAFEKLPRLESEDVADVVVYALSTPPHVQIHEVIVKPVGEPF